MMLEKAQSTKLINITNLLFITYDNLVTTKANTMYTTAEIEKIYPEYDGEMFKVSSKYKEYVGIKAV